MSNDFREYPDSEDYVRRLFIRDFEELGETNVGTEIPDDIETRLPYVRAARLSGPSARLNDYPVMDIEAFAKTVAEAKSLCSRLTDYLLGYPRDVEVGARRVVIDRADCNSARERRPWSDDTIARFGSIIRLSVRR